jgi:hypothetical protein
MWEMTELSLLLPDTQNKFRTLYMEGKNIKDILAILGIPENTYYSYLWRDQQGFRQFINAIEMEYLKNLARKNLKEVAEMDLTGVDDVRYLKIKTDTSQFLAETADKENFSKKTEENTDKTPINIAINNYKRIQSYKKSLPPPIKP